ncbi:BT4734/BF3469 family protein [Kordia sp.]|uniref:BT4734/BF3469 family protein n=1 Tax=Kordia sp. TaxID=1965332 RepID=UPI003D26CADF
MKVSKFKNIYSKTTIVSDLGQELMDIKNGKYQNEIKKCRFYTKANKYDEYKTLKIKLPLVAFCGTFEKGRKLENLSIYNRLIILDIDHIEKTEILDVKKLLKNDIYIYSVWISPSGEGLKALVKLDGDIDDHKSSFESLKKYFLDNYNVKLDNSGSDITRLCFASWDSELHLNEYSEVYKDKVEIESKVKTSKKSIRDRSLSKSAYATEGLNKPEHRQIIKLIIKFLRKKEISITESFDNWFRVAMGISSTFSYDLGEKYFLNLCEQDKENHDELESINILRYCYNNRKIGISTLITFGTIIFYAKEKGFITKKDKFL